MVILYVACNVHSLLISLEEYIVSFYIFFLVCSTIPRLLSYLCLKHFRYHAYSVPSCHYCTLLPLHLTNTLPTYHNSPTLPSHAIPLQPYQLNPYTTTTLPTSSSAPISYHTSIPPTTTHPTTIPTTSLEVTGIHAWMAASVVSATTLLVKGIETKIGEETAGQGEGEGVMECGRA